MSVVESVTQMLRILGLASDAPEGILAFRTITSLTAMVQQRPYKSSDEEKPTEGTSRDLALSVALSIVAALEHNVVATVAKQEFDQLQVIVCSDTPRTDDRPFLLQLASDINAGDLAGAINTLKFLMTKNDRPEENDNANVKQYPTVIPARLPEGLQDSSNTRELIDYVNGLCKDDAPIHPPRLHLPLHQHVEVLRRLLFLKCSPGDLAKYFLRYIVASSYLKMHTRMERTSSMALLGFITAVSIADLVRVHAEVQQPKQSSTKKDRDFLVYFAGVIPAEWKTEFPRLHSLANCAKDLEITGPAKSFESIQLYNTETREEFHNMFIQCLRDFADGLRELVKIRESPQDAKNNTKNFRFYAKLVAQRGDCLQKLARTHALQMHLQTIALLRTASLDGTLESMPGRNPEPAYTKDEVDGENDEIEPLQTDNNVSPVIKPYRDWLRLIVAEFGAADILIQQFVVKFRQEVFIDIQVLQSPSVDEAKLTWKDLFRDHIAESQAFGINNKQILNYLTNIESTCNKATRFLDQLKQAWAAGEMTKLKTMIDSAEPMTKFQEEVQPTAEKSTWWMFWLEQQDKDKLKLMPDWPPLLHEIYTLVAESAPTNSAAAQLMEARVALAFTSLHESLCFFRGIAKTKTNNFTGRVHCEACLASLITSSITEETETNMEFRKAQEATKGFGKVVGVSKRCCPACSRLLEILKHEGGSFITRGSHGTVTACSLPIWLPTGVVKQMNNEYGIRLRDELINLIREPEMRRRRAKSTGSSGKSSSDEGGEHQKWIEPNFGESDDEYD